MPPSPEPTDPPPSTAAADAWWRSLPFALRSPTAAERLRADYFAPTRRRPRRPFAGRPGRGRRLARRGRRCGGRPARRWSAPSTGPPRAPERSRTTVEVVTDDMPFLVESLTSALTGLGRGIDTVVHPRLAARPRRARCSCSTCTRPTARRPATRSRPGSASRSTGSSSRRSARRAGGGAVGRARRRPCGGPRLAADAGQGARDRRRAPQQRPASGAATTRRRSPPGSCTGSPTTASRSSATASTTLAAADGALAGCARRTGLGCSRRRHGRPAQRPAVRGRRPEPAAQRCCGSQGGCARDGAPLGVRRLRVRRQRDAAGEVTGERRFLGLFTSGAYTESVRRVPRRRREGRGGAAPCRVRSRRPLRARPAEHPGVLPPRRAACRPRSTRSCARRSACCQLQERRRTRLFLRPTLPAASRPAWCSCRVTGTRRPVGAGRRGPAPGALDGGSAEHTLQVSESALARLHVVVRPRPGEELTRR